MPNSPTAKQEQMAPITNSEQILLANENKSAYWIQDFGGNFANPLMINPMVNIQDIYTYFENNNPGNKYGGIRFYPAYENNTVFLIMCRAEGGAGDLSKTGEDKYLKLNKGLLNSKGAVLAASNTLDSKTAMDLHQRYMNEVFLYKNKQDTSATKDTIRYSRFFAWDEFKMLTDQNLKGGAKDQFLFQIEIGYVTAGMAATLDTRKQTGITTEQNQGFTVIVHVKDQNGNSLLNPFGRYDASKPTEYEGKAMEVATPCPPRCGVAGMR